MLQVFDYIDFADEDLIKVGEVLGDPVYGVVDGIYLRVARYEFPAMRTQFLWGMSVNRLKEVRITKSTGPNPFHGVIHTFESVFKDETVTRREVPILNVSADTLSELLFKMNREMYLIRQALADIVH